MSGFDAPQMNFVSISLCSLSSIRLSSQTLLPVILGHTPAGTSAKTVAQFAQGYNSKRFCHFDYGDSLTNTRMYGTSHPPDYDLAMVRLPVLLYWGNNDWLATPVDVENIAQQLPNLIASVRVRQRTLSFNINKIFSFLFTGSLRWLEPPRLHVGQGRRCSPVQAYHSVHTTFPYYLI